MEEMNQKDTDRLSAGLRKMIDGHGYGFQYSVLGFLKKLYSEGKSAWLFEAAEFPVEVQGKVTHIDFILRPQGDKIFMVAECKRVDPKFSDWCFVRAPFVRRNQSLDKFVVETLRWHTGHMKVRVANAMSPFVLDPSEAYHIGFALKNHQKDGENPQSGRDAIGEAVSQVCRGVYGLVETIAQKLRPELKGNESYAQYVLIPVIFTTARLWVIDDDLSLADIETGKLSSDSSILTEKDWIYYQYNTSPGLKHTIPSGTKSDVFADLLYQEYLRTIPIVTTKGIGSFMEQHAPERFVV